MRKQSRHVSVWMNDIEYRHLKAQAQTAAMGMLHTKRRWD